MLAIVSAWWFAFIWRFSPNLMFVLYVPSMGLCCFVMLSLIERTEGRIWQQIQTVMRSIAASRWTWVPSAPSNDSEDRQIAPGAQSDSFRG